MDNSKVMVIVFPDDGEENAGHSPDLNNKTTPPSLFIFP
jgi:hypothetical protein